ncbi:response regulator [Phreatobacter sp.]|uniref:response regulator n=1 Tax=Phreatobacter sp. TaxID=1966341 RepID=UPI0025F59382|nr:response regulator [Phreatobacter sp.]
MHRHRILIVEDDPVIAMDIEAAVLEDLGPPPDVIVVGSLADAWSVAADLIHCALLDVDVVGGKTFDVALTLRARGTPFAFVSGSLPADLPEALRGARFVRKPFQARDILGFVAAALTSRHGPGTGAADPAGGLAAADRPQPHGPECPKPAIR